jgi:Tfp pilus assembly protein PilN
MTLGLNPGPNDPDQGQGAAGKWPVVVLVLWLVVIGMLVFFLPLLLASAGIRRDANRLQGDIGFVRQTIVAMETPPADVLAAMQERDAALAKAASIQQAATEIATNFVDWPAVMAAVAGHDVSRVALSSVQQSGSEVTLYGRAVNDSAVVSYARQLEASNLFLRVVVRSIRAVETPFATAALSGAPTVEGPTPTSTQTLTPTPDLRDAFEPDDFDAQELFLGVPQQRNFYPVYDVDTFRFLAKAGRYYQIWTYDLAEGVDTFMTANVGPTTYTNDDRAVGDLSSEITFFNSLGTDVEAHITVTNRGQFGPSAAYKINVKEITPTATPIPSATGVPTQTPVPTATLVPTQTPLPTATSTPTPDFADAYEPDDVQPKPIAVGETQRHSFYPVNDVDKVTFLAKAGRSYRVKTSNLAVGVDTLLFVLVGGASYTNDDRVPGDASSEVIFTVNQGYDVQAVVEILNRGQYGPGKEYDITVEEIVLAPTATPVPPTATPDLRDAYEPDDVTPRPIAVGETQARTFYPAGDVDKATFLAKAGRTYRVSTGDLALGVDTILTVIVPGAMAPYVNDDRQPNDPSSDLSFTVGASDVDVVIEVRNRGAFGPQAAYKLTVRELIVTPVPTHTPTSLGDSYEPDDLIPKPIAIGEAQTHTFYPAGDIDKVTFLAKAGRWYTVSTSNLALGVDTVLTVEIGGATHVNDDASTTPGDYSSFVNFQAAPQDMWAVVTITNKGLYGVDKSYRVTVSEVAAPVSGLGSDQWRARAQRSPGLAADARFYALSGDARWSPAGPLWPASQAFAPVGQQLTGSVEFVIALELKRGSYEPAR